MANNKLYEENVCVQKYFMAKKKNVFSLFFPQTLNIELLKLSSLIYLLKFHSIGFPNFKTLKK